MNDVYKRNLMNKQPLDMEDSHTKKLLYFTVIDIEEKGFAGVAKKVLGQVEAFEELGYDVQLLCFASSQLAMLHHDEKTVYEHFSVCCFHRRIQLCYHLSDLCCQEHFDIVYIRYPQCDWWFYRNLAKLRPSVEKVIIEIPTYPYDGENKHNHNFMTTLCVWQDKHFRKKIHQYVDLIVTYGNVHEKKIFGIPYCVICNGISGNVLLQQYPNYKKHDTLNIIAVANLMYHHRYDKVLRGMAKYLSMPDSNKQIRFHLIGDGPEKKNLMDLTDKLNIKEYVIFHGAKTGQDLIDIYSIADLGLVGFSSVIPNTTIYCNSSLKFSEYCAVGLPHAGAGRHQEYPENNHFFIIPDITESEINIQQLVDFVLNVNLSKAKNEMLDVLKRKLTWKTIMSQVLERLAVC